MSNTIDLRQMRETAVSQIKETEKELTPRSITFSLVYNAPNGKTYQDQLTSKVMDGEARLIKTRVFTQLTRGMILDSVPMEEKLRLEAISRTVAQIEDAPDWFNEWCVQDNELLKEVNDLLIDHEFQFFKSDVGEGEEGKRKKRVSITCTALTQDETS